MADAETKPQVAEKQTNCLSCNKPIKKKKKYYRNGKYYCSIRCYKNFINKAEKKDEGK